MPRFRAPHLALVMSLVSSACGRSDDVTGSATMPADFGGVQTAVLSCPDLDGVFALPAAQGHPFGYAGARAGRTAEYRDFFGLPLHDAQQLWVSGPRLGEAQPLTLRTRAVNRNPDVSGTTVRDWPHVELSAGEYDCQEGWLNVTERDWEQPGAASWFGGAGVRITARATRLKDGSLVVGQAVRVWGRKSKFEVAGHALFTRHEPDRVTWYWTRFAPIKASGIALPRDTEAPVPVRTTAVTMRDRSTVVLSADSLR